MSEIRYDRSGAIKVMAEADNYLMVRRPRCAPFVMPLREWHKLAPTLKEAQAAKIIVSLGRVL